MNVVFLCFESRNRPSSRVRAYHFAEQLADRGYRVRVLSMADRFGLAGERAYRLSDLRKLVYNARVLPELADPSAIFYIQKIGWHVVAPLLARWINRGANRVVLDYDDWDVLVQPFRTLRLTGLGDVARLTARIFRTADAVVTASTYLFEYARAVGRPQQPIYLIPTVADTSKFTPAYPPRSPSDTALRPVTFCWLGLIWNEEMFENVSELIRAFGELRSSRPCRLSVAGQYYHYEAKLRRLAAALPPGRVLELPGWVDPERIPTILTDVDVGLFMLSRDTEYNRAKSPTKLFEYMAAGLPSVAGYIGEAQQVLENAVTGYTVRNFDELRAAMDLLADSDELRARLGARARRAAQEHYSLERAASQLEDVLQAVSEGGSGT